ncbi:hypothetical protein QTP70_028342 [Hemibagrus guttatus]|uniref:Uncharacterized protein n=1 Tax=Hemibagrus guttatus TaxID=175788 RepID=A0AAE0RK80_9TELE|nr:hypothetical protein QTP70_028342 [Hemibagrus guttatus]
MTVSGIFTSSCTFLTAYMASSGIKAGYTLDGVPTHGRAHTHSFTTGYLETPISREACLWTVGGNRSTRRKPTKHGENMQTPHTQ